MKKPIISIICALSENRAIGRDNKLLWHIPEDLKRFKEITFGHTVIMGRKTYESIGRLLPERTNIIITSNPTLRIKGGLMFASFKEALNYAKKREEDEIFIIGGGEIYRQALPLTDKLYLTVVKGKYEADTYFPDYSEFKKVIKKEKKYNKDYHYTFLELER